MRKLDVLKAAVMASPHMKLQASGEDGLAFIWNRRGSKLYLVVSNGMGWDHVSVSRRKKLPSYEDMKAAKRFCFQPDEWAVEFHPPPSDYVSIHDNTLHIWRPNTVDLPTPPEFMV